jgi:hypothetical protein
MIAAAYKRSIQLRRGAEIVNRCRGSLHTKTPFNCCNLYKTYPSPL